MVFLAYSIMVRIFRRTTNGLFAELYHYLHNIECMCINNYCNMLQLLQEFVYTHVDMDTFYL